MKKFITFSFLPSSSDLGLLALRCWFGLTLFSVHGLDKLRHFGGTVEMFHDKMGIPTVFGACSVIAEGICSVCLAIGLGTRWAALILAVNMAVAFQMGHGRVLIAPHPGVMTGEMAFLYLGAFAALFLAGGGRFSADAALRKS